MKLIQSINRLEIQLDSQVCFENDVGFTVSHEITIIIYDTMELGQFTDELMRQGVQVKSFEWKNDEFEGDEETMESGLGEAIRDC